MNPPPRPELEAPLQDIADTPAAPRGGRSRLRRAGDATVLWLHRLADRFDLVPTEFGRDTEVDDTDAGSIAREWRRQAKLWADYNPEEMFALKAGAAGLGLGLVVLLMLVGAVR